LCFTIFVYILIFRMSFLNFWFNRAWPKVKRKLTQPIYFLINIHTLI
jgi:hypothetical protein